LNVAISPATLEPPFGLKTPAPRHTVVPVLRIALWFGILAGLMEGVGFLIFERINWERWALMVHVSKEILWISVLVDVAFFCAVAIPIAALGHFVQKFPVMKVGVFAFAFLTAYDWLEVTERLDNRACILLGLGVAAAVSRWFAKRETKAVRFWDKSLPWLLTGAVLVFGWVEGGRALREYRSVSQLPAAAPNSPNILLVVLDTLRADHVSSYGYTRPTTPNIDRLAREGVLFENAFSTSPWSLPSHASIVTGRYQFDHGVENIDPNRLFMWTQPVLGKYPTLGEALQQKGYRTGAFSANRIYFSANLGFAQGFQHFEDYFHSPADMFMRTLFGRVFVRRYLYRSWKSLPKRFLLHFRFTKVLDPDEEGSAGHSGPFTTRKRAETVNREALRWIDKNREHPFFAFLNYFDVHHPYGGPEFGFTAPWEEKERVDRYDGGLKYADDQLGWLMAELQKRGIAKNTIVVITADHGESLMQHSLESHGKALYSEEIRVPLIFFYPGHMPAGLRINTVVTNASIAATLAEAAGVEEGKEFPTPSLTSLWQGSSSGVHWPPVLAEVSDKQFWGKNDVDAPHMVVPTAVQGAMKAVVAEDWHLIVHKKLGVQLYNLKQDPGETRNLVETAAGRAAALNMFPELQDLLSDGHGAKSQLEKINSTANVLNDLSELRHSVLPRERVDDYWRISTAGGNRITVDVQAVDPGSALDPVITLEDAHGDLLASCRDLSDDHIPSPGVADPTPEAFDDVCINDDANVGNSSARLELEVPGKGNSPVEFFVRVSDWNGSLGVARQYQISVHKGSNSAQLGR